jgi:hypothetical protein
MTLPLKAKVQNGRLILDEPVNLPDGTEVELVPFAPGDELDDEDRKRLHEELRLSAEELEAGGGIDADEALRRIKNRHPK